MISKVKIILSGLIFSLPGAAMASGEALLPTSHFAPPEVPNEPAEKIEGTLEIGEGGAALFDLHANSFRIDRKAQELETIPALRVDLVEDGSRILPVQRGPIRGTHPHWEWIVQPGEAWRDDDGVSWLSLPVALAERNANCVHNGLLKINLSDPGQPADFQIASETCAYLQFDMRAGLPVRFTARPVPNAPAVIAADKRERAARLPEKPVSMLPFADRLAAEDQVPAGALTAYGTVLEGTHYVSDCPTRAGPYPFCAELVLPSYSWAKSIFAGVAAMRLEHLYPGAMQRRIAPYVGGCDEDGWGDVTVSHVLNMASGHYNSREHEVDEGSAAMQKFFLVEDHPGKILIACKAFGRRTDPGKRFVYRTGDTYIAGTAMTAILRTERQEASADLHTDLLAPIWQKLGLSALMDAPRRTYDESAIPFSGWGLYLTRADLARIAAFLQRGGTIDGEALLDPDMLAKALQQGDAPHGLRAASDDQRYRNGFWAWNAGPYLGCEADRWIPLMSGFGGLTAALLPGERLYWHVSDGGTYRWGASAKAIHEYHPLCGETE